jgi:hypothetical protein
VSYEIGCLSESEFGERIRGRDFQGDRSNGNRGNTDERRAKYIPVPFGFTVASARDTAIKV